MKKFITYVFYNILFVGIVFFSYQSYQYATKFEKQTTKLVEQQTIAKLTKNNLKNIGEKITFGLYKNKIKEEIIQIKKNMDYLYSTSIRYFIYVASIFLLFLFSYSFVDLKIFNIYGVFFVFVLLSFGLISPMFMMTIHKDFSMIGDVVLSFESKSLLGSVERMISEGKYLLGGAIFLFSVFIPIVKNLTFLFVSVFSNFQFIHKVVDFFKSIGKWSMIDVFIVSIILVYFTTMNGEMSRGEIEVGIYFFFFYVLGSMILSGTIVKMLKN